MFQGTILTLLPSLPEEFHPDQSVTQSFFLWHSIIGGKNVIRLIKRLLLKLGVREVGETQCQPQRVLDPRIPERKLVPIPSLKSHFILLCPNQITVPNEIKPLSLLLEMLLLQSRGTARGRSSTQGLPVRRWE